jgi:hypothetical protein
LEQSTRSKTDRRTLTTSWSSSNHPWTTGTGCTRRGITPEENKERWDSTSQERKYSYYFRKYSGGREQFGKEQTDQEERIPFTARPAKRYGVFKEGSFQILDESPRSINNIYLDSNILISYKSTALEILELLIE